MLEHIKTNDTVYVTVNYHNPTGGFSIPSSQTPQWLVYRGAETVPMLSGPMVSRGIIGSYVAAFVASVANGFEPGVFYDVQASGLINNEPVFKSIKQFVLGDLIDANILQVNNEAVLLADRVDANITHVNDQSVTLADLQGSGGGGGGEVTNLQEVAVAVYDELISDHTV